MSKLLYDFFFNCDIDFKHGFMSKLHGKNTNCHCNSVSDAWIYAYIYLTLTWIYVKVAIRFFNGGNNMNKFT